MTDKVYESNSIPWQIGLRTRQAREWVSYQFNRGDGLIDEPEAPDVSWLEPLREIIFWLSVILVTAWLVWLLYPKVMAGLERMNQTWSAASQEKRADTKHLSAQEWWNRAQQFAQAGQFQEACEAVYQAMLAQLHERQQIPLDPSRTDREYLRLLASDEPPPRPYQLLFGTHERLTFGQAIASSELFQRCRQAYLSLQQR